MTSIYPKLLFASAALLAAGSYLTSAAVEIGDTREEVFAALGEPNGSAVTDDIEAYTFDRGRVIFYQGRVQSRTVVSPEEAAEQRQLAQRRIEERMQRGQALREQTLENPEFAKLSPRQRLAFWQSFREQFPEVEAGFEYAVAARQAQAARREEMQDLNLRVMEAERMAALTEQQNRVVTGYGGGLPLFYDDFFSSRGRFPHGDKKRPFVFPLDPPTPRERFMPLQSVPLGRVPKSVVPLLAPPDDFPSPVHLPRSPSAYPHPKHRPYDSNTRSRSHYPGGSR